MKNCSGLTAADYLSFYLLHRRVYTEYKLIKTFDTKEKYLSHPSNTLSPTTPHWYIKLQESHCNWIIAIDFIYNTTSFPCMNGLQHKSTVSCYY